MGNRYGSRWSTVVTFRAGISGPYLTRTAYTGRNRLVRWTNNSWRLSISNRYCKGTSNAVICAIRHLKGIGRYAHRKCRTRSQACRPGGGCPGTIVRSNRSNIVQDCTALVKIIVRCDIRRTSDRWQLGVIHRNRKGAGRRIVRSVRHLKSIGRNAYRER